MSKNFWRLCGHRLRVTRLALGITEQEAATAAKITIRTWRKWEAGGHQKSSLHNLVSFAKKFDVNIVWLMFGAEEYAAEVERCPQLRNGSVGLGKIAILPVCRSAVAS
jgi:transcriptional regulator with XRE-family HTH domain